MSGQHGRGILLGCQSDGSLRMTTSEIDPKKFWDDKILGWEESRYSTSKGQSLLEKLAGRASQSLRFRLQMAVQLLVPHAKGRRVVEVGCGSGLLAEPILERGAASYIGIDISDTAINAARQRVAASGLAKRAEFAAADVLSFPLLDTGADLVLSLGLLDWLTLDEIRTLFQNASGLEFIHSFSEKRFSLGQLIHRAYVNISYGHRTGAYIPRYYQAHEVVNVVRPFAPAEVRVVRDPRLSFGAFLTALAAPATPVRSDEHDAALRIR